MKNLLSKIAALILAVSLCLFVFGCGDTTNDDVVQTTGDYKYKITTGTRDVVDENGEVVLDEEGNAKQESYKYYVITGYQVSSEDALKMSSGDFSTVTDYRSIEIPKTGKDLGEDNEYPVEEIEAGAFTNQIILTEVKVGNNIKKIGEGAFAGCTNLKTLKLPFVGESLEATNNARVFGHIFGNSATNDGNVEVTSKITERKDQDGNSILTESSVTFKVPKSLQEVSLEASEITNISECAFYGMTMIKKVIIPDTVTEIDSHAFYNCSGLLEFNLNKVVTVFESAFANCTNLRVVNFSAVENIKQAAFQGCTSLGSKRFASDNAESEEALTIKLPSSVKEIGKGAFKGCSSVKYFNIKETQVTTIDNSVFADCLGLVKITIKDGSLIKTGAFVNCTELAIDTDSNGEDDSYNVVGTYTAEESAFDKLA